MKNPISYIIFIALLFLVVVSCEKEEPISEEPISDESNENVNSTIRYIKETNGNEGLVNYTFDSLNRVIKIENGPTDVMKMEYTYNSTGNISTIKITDSEGINLTTFEYNTEGILTGSSTNNGLADFTYEFDNNKLVKVSSYGNIPNVGRKLMGRAEFDYDGENVSEFREYTLNFMTDGLALSEKVTYEHDTKKNPFYELDIQNSVINLGHEQFASRNNCIRRTVIMSSYGDPLGTYEISFDYNTDGYPTQSSDGTQFTYY
jgi:hypothetical protein